MIMLQNNPCKSSNNEHQLCQDVLVSERNINDDHFLSKITIIACSSLPAVGATAVSPTLTEIEDYFHEINNISLLSRMVVSLPALTIALFSPLSGHFLDKYNKKVILLVSIIFYAIFGAGGGWFNSIYILLTLRGLFGITIGTIMTCTTSLIGDYCLNELERRRFLHYQNVSMQGAAGISLIFGGAIATISWRLSFQIYLLAIFIALLVYFTFKAKILYHKEELQTKSDSNGINISQNYIGLKKLSIIILVYILTFYTGIVFYLVPAQLPFMLRDEFSESSTFISGASYCTLSFSCVLVCFIFSKIKAQFSNLTYVAYMFTIFGCGYIIISIASNVLIVFIGLGVAGHGFGIIFPILSRWLMDISPPYIYGRILGFWTAFLYLGCFLSPIILQYLFIDNGLKYAFYFVGLLTVSIGLLFGFSKLYLYLFHMNQ